MYSSSSSSQARFFQSFFFILLLDSISSVTFCTHHTSSQYSRKKWKDHFIYQIKLKLNEVSSCCQRDEHTIENETKVVYKIILINWLLSPALDFIFHQISRKFLCIFSSYYVCCVYDRLVSFCSYVVFLFGVVINDRMGIERRRNDV